MKHHRTPLSWCFLVSLVLSAGALPCAAHPESIGNWMPQYALVLGLASDGLPFDGEFVDEFTATVAKPAALCGAGLSDLRAGDKVTLTNHYNGYWTITHIESKRRLKIPLAWNVRFGVRPEPDLADGDPPDRITGRVVAPAIIAGYGFPSARVGMKFVLEYDEKNGWQLSLEGTPSKVKVPV